jgi:hypothetical protein
MVYESYVDAKCTGVIAEEVGTQFDIVLSVLNDSVGGIDS